MCEIMTVNVIGHREISNSIQVGCGVAKEYFKPGLNSQFTCRVVAKISLFLY